MGKHVLLGRHARIGFLLFISSKSRRAVFWIIFKETVKDCKTEREAEFRIQDIVFYITKKYMHKAKNTDSQKNEKKYITIME